MQTVRVAVAGVSGKTGGAVTRALMTREDVIVVGGVSRRWAGQKLGEALGVGKPSTGAGVWSSVGELLEVFRREGQLPDVLVDFTTGEVAGGHALLAIEHGVHPVVGATGLPEEDVRRIEERVNQTGIGTALIPNFSLGAALLDRFAVEAAAYYDDLEVIERHHETKRDAPSGTAKRLALRLAEARGRDHIPVHSVRLPGYVAQHEVTFGGSGERLTIIHETVDRQSFASGVVLAARAVLHANRVVYNLGELLTRGADND